MESKLIPLLAMVPLLGVFAYIIYDITKHRAWGSFIKIILAMGAIAIILSLFFWGASKL